MTNKINVASIQQTMISLSQIRKQIVETPFAAEILVKTGKKKRVFQAEDINRFHSQQFPEAKRFSSTSFLKGLFSVFYGVLKAHDLIPDNDVGSAQSFVPYFKDSTSLVVYNFFSKNYGIRDPIWYRLVLFDGLKPVWIDCRVLAADSVVHIPIKPIETANNKLPERGNLVLQAFHPRIKIQASQLRYFCLYRNKTEGTISGVHALALPRQGLTTNFKPTFRSFGPAKAKALYHTFANPMTTLRSKMPTERLSALVSDSHLLGDNGYITIHNQSEMSPSAIWHDGPTHHRVGNKTAQSSGYPLKTAFSVPSFETSAPIVMMHASQIGFLPSEVTVEAYSQEWKLLSSRLVQIKREHDSIDLRELFTKESWKGLINFVIDFKRNANEFSPIPACYVHIYYRSRNGFSDQIHSHSTVGYRNDPFRKLTSYRCRKFAPLLIEDGLEFIYSIILVGGSEESPADLTCKVRIISDKGAERVMKVKLKANTINHLNASDLVKLIDGDIDRAGIVQLEHEETNLNASWFAIDRKTGHIGVDHFTGG